MTVFAPLASEAMVQGKGTEQPLPVMLVMVRFDGVSVTWMFVAVDGPLLVTVIVYWMVSAVWDGPAGLGGLTSCTTAAATAGAPFAVLAGVFALVWMDILALTGARV